MPGGGRVVAVEVGSPADAAGIRPDEVIVTAGGEELTDILAWQWASADETVSITASSPDGALRDLTLERETGQEWGITFAELLFDGIRTCHNACSFCFVSQLPSGLRPSLYVKDDDYRLSFLTGNFVTLTNLDEIDVARILIHRLSPMYVSVHAVTPRVRARVLCTRHEDRGLETLDRLLDGGIDVHAQIVLVPGLNDGEELDATLERLAGSRSVVSVGVVPLGWTSHQSLFTHSFEEPEASAAVLDRLAPWRARMLASRGARWVYAADEFHLNAGREVPSADEYDGFPQSENGIGLVRGFVDELARESKRVAKVAEAWKGGPVSLVTGELFAPVLEAALVDAHLGKAVRVVSVANRLFGGSVSVTGLLAGADVADAISSDGDEGPWLVPDIVVNVDGVTLDDLTHAELEERSGAAVRLVSSDAQGLVEGLTSVLESRREAG